MAKAKSTPGYKKIAYQCTVALLAAVVFLFVLPMAKLYAQETEIAQTPTLELASKADSYLVMDLDSGQVLLGNAEQAARYPASITKIVTLALVQQAINNGTISWDTQVTVSQSALDALIPDAATCNLFAGEVLTVQDLVYATQIKSANDAANVLAELLGGSIEAFAQIMNEQVAALGLNGTHFTNPSGLPDTAHYTTAYDMAQLTRWALSVPGYADLFAARDYYMGPTNMFDWDRSFTNSNSLLNSESDYYLADVTGGKSGYTDAAAYTLVTTAEREGMRLICVVLHCQNNEDKYLATTSLLNYSFASFTRYTYNVPKLQSTQVPVYGGGAEPLGEVTLQPANDTGIWLHNSLSLDAVSASYQVPESYVLGSEFAPALVLSVGDGSLQYQTALSLPLEWGGIEDVLTANTNYNFASQQRERVQTYQNFRTLLYGVAIMLLVGAFVLLVLLYLHTIKGWQNQRRRRQTEISQKHRQQLRHIPAHAPAYVGTGKQVYTARQPATRAAYQTPAVPANNRRRPAVRLSTITVAEPNGLPRTGQR